MDAVATILAVREWAQGSAEVCDRRRDGGPCEQLATALALRFDALEATLDGLLGTERARLAKAVEEAAAKERAAAETWHAASRAFDSALNQGWSRRMAGAQGERLDQADADLDAARTALGEAKANLAALDKEAGR